MGLAELRGSEQRAENRAGSAAKRVKRTRRTSAQRGHLLRLCSVQPRILDKSGRMGRTCGTFRGRPELRVGP
jgi:hypothetical protein